VDAERFVCTETNTREGSSSVICYSIREKGRKRRRRQQPQPQPRVQPRAQPQRRTQPQQRAYAYDWVAFEPSFTELLPSLRAELPNKVPFYDPGQPDHVIIAPQDFVEAWHMDRAIKPLQQFLEEMQSKRNEFVRNMLQLPPAVVQWGLVLVAGGVLFLAARAAAVGAAAVTSIETSATLVIPPAGHLVLPLAAGGETTTLVLAASRAAALLASPAAKAIATGAGGLGGALIVIGKASVAQAAADPGMGHPGSGDITVIRAVAVAAFAPRGGMLSAFSARGSNLFPAPCSDPSAPGNQIGLGKKVLFDGKPHFIIGLVEPR